MATVYKLFLFGIIFTGMLVLSYRTFRLLNNKIKSSETGWQLLGYSLLLLLVNGLLFFGGLTLLVYSYTFLAGL